MDKNTRLGKWPNNPTQPIRESTLGIVGLGRIGKSLAVRARAMNMRVIATEAMPDHDFIKKEMIELVSLESLLQ